MNDMSQAPEAPLLTASDGFQSWLREIECSLALTSIDRERLFFIGMTAHGEMWAHERHFRGMQCALASADEIWLATAYEIWSFRNTLPAGTAYRENGADRLYCPRVSFVTGALNVHEFGIGRERETIFVNTQYSCLAVPDMEASFKPIWQPHFISQLKPDDRCHLNGLAMDDGVPAYVTARGKHDTPFGWTDTQDRGGLLMSVTDNEIVSDQLCMPHSPRCHDGKVWVLNTGTCEFGQVDPETGRFEPVCAIPGYGRGMSMIGDYAVISVSMAREDDGFAALPVADALDRHDLDAVCGLGIVNLKSGELQDWVMFQHTVRELMSVSVIPGVRQPAMIGLQDKTMVSSVITLPEMAA